MDLPGFGKSELRYPYDIDDYVLELKKFISDNNIERPILIGHSFGCRVIIKYCVSYPVKKIVLIDAAGIVRRGVQYYLKVYSYKLIRNLLTLLGKKDMVAKLRKKVGSNDYNKANEMMKEVLKRIHVDLRDYIMQIKVETLLIWGENDKTTPLKDGKIMNKLIENSGLVIIPNAQHFPFIENENLCLKVLESYLL